MSAPDSQENAGRPPRRPLLIDNRCTDFLGLNDEDSCTGSETMCGETGLIYLPTLPAALAAAPTSPPLDPHSFLLLHDSFFHCCLFIVNLNNFSSFFLSFPSLLTASNALLIRVTLTPIPPDPLTAYVHPHTLPCFITLVAPYPHTRSPSITLVSISINCFSTSPLPFLFSIMSYLYRGSHYHLIPLTFLLYCFVFLSTTLSQVKYTLSPFTARYLHLWPTFNTIFFPPIS